MDLLGKSEGLLLKREQSPTEEFKLGQRIRAYCLEVKKEALSEVADRHHPACQASNPFPLEHWKIY